MIHNHQPVYAAGTPLDKSSAVLILLHGRGATAEDILALGMELHFPELALLAPQAEGYTWYPNRFTSPLDQNEPYLSSALALIDGLVEEVEGRGISSERIFIGGFSQGACLATEYVIRKPRRYGGLLAFSGGYIGPMDMKRKPSGGLASMLAFLGCSDVDPHIPLQRVKETTALLQAMGAQVKESIYSQMGHTVNKDEILTARNLIEKNMA